MRDTPHESAPDPCQLVPGPPEHCGDIFCAPCKARFPRDHAYYERIELQEYFSTYDSEDPPTR